MAYAGKVLAEGQGAATKTTVYTVPASTVAFVKFFNIFNTSATSQTVLIYLNLSGTSRLWRRIVLGENESATLLDEGESVQLEAADLIEITTTTASVLDYIITGVEES